MKDYTLYLPLKKCWFDLISSGVKLEEYREINLYWMRRLCVPLPRGRYSLEDFYYFQRVVFTLGYPRKGDLSRRVAFRDINIRVDFGRPEWGAEPGKKYFVISWGSRCSAL